MDPTAQTPDKPPVTKPAPEPAGAVTPPPAGGPPAKTPNALMVPAAIVLAGVLVAGSILLSQGMGGRSGGAPDSGSQQANAGQAVAVNIKDVSMNNAPFVGKADAPVTLAYWFDYQCPFCGAVEGFGPKELIDALKRNDPNWAPVIPQLMDQYVKAGKLKIVFKMFPFLGADSSTAALAARAVWDSAPKAFFDWQTKMFQSQGQENSGWATKDKVIAITKQVAGIDAAKVDRLMDQNKDAYQKLIDADKNEAGKFGINGTPGFIVGTKMISGAQSAGVFTKAIDAMLK